MANPHAFIGYVAASFLATATFAANVPDDLESTRFSDASVTPCPACLCVAPTGEVFVGVDLNGSLGKGPGKGRIVRLIDEDADGRADRHTVFAEIDNPRGLISLGTKVWVLHTVIPKDTGILEALHLSVLEDADRDGVADGPPTILVSNLSPPKHNQDRGADHTTNGIRMGIDGWIYIAVGDFGIHGARGADGTELTMLGGGIVRVRPDGSELEVYTHGLRNIYDVAIDPLLNLFTRGNTNDGGGWNVRFIHQVQTGEYGYPVLFKHFTDEIIPALVDLGGGSGTGSLWLQEPGWPERWNDVPMMCDWGRSQLVVHRVTPDGPSFTQSPETFIGLEQITDLDVDASGRLYLGAWAGAGYQGNPGRGWVDRVVPKGWTFGEFPDPATLSVSSLTDLMRTESATARLAASQELVRRGEGAHELLTLARDADAGVENRVAAIFTIKQISGSDANGSLLDLTSDATVREWALRASTDRKGQMDGVEVGSLALGLGDANPRVRVAAAVALGRLGDPAAANALLAVTTPEASTGRRTNEPDDEGPHATPRAGIVLPHIAVRSLVSLRPIDACLDALGGPYTDGALWALRQLHEESVTRGLIAAYATTSNEELRAKLVTALVRLHHREARYDGSWWWGTRPDTHGPYYVRETWSGSEQVREFLRRLWDADEQREVIARENARCRAGLDWTDASSPERVTSSGEAGASVDLAKLAEAEGEIAKTSIEDIILSITTTKGDASNGEAIFERQGCTTCHTTKKGQPLKGPYMGQVGAVLSRDQIAESILKPSASIAQGFASTLIVTSDGRSLTGFVSRDTADEIDLRDATGAVHTIPKKAIVVREDVEGSIMPEGLANSLSLEEFASLVSFLQSQKG